MHAIFYAAPMPWQLTLVFSTSLWVIFFGRHTYAISLEEGTRITRNHGCEGNSGFELVSFQDFLFLFLENHYFLVVGEDFPGLEKKINNW